MKRSAVDIILRKAQPEDIELLNYWDQQEHNIFADPNDKWDWEIELGRNPDWRMQLMAELNGRPIGFIQIIDPYKEESHYWGEVEKNFRAIDIWIGEAKDIGKGYGTVMMQKAIDICFSNKTVEAILIDPLTINTRAIRFYQRFGFEFVEYRKFGDDECSVYRLERSKWESIKAFLI
ncbi:GNAT family N-acetyltransferase [Shivajiella indica]|uniref:GNAT family N-acetyltransferase n=1 Tax=Shivajiella indica TaxID=872115 RepID=A0ABW5BDB5_9BACT